MEKRVLICFFVLFLVVANVKGDIEKSVTGEIITGEATSGVAALNITVLPSLPTLTIKKPRNETYFINYSLKIEIETNANNLWYNLNNGANISFPSGEDEMFFNTSFGSHKLFVFANNSFGVTSRNVTFTIAPNMFSMNYTEFDGSSTNFNKFSYEEIQNLTNITFEVLSFGKIKFNVPINVTDDYNSSNGFVNIDNFINISFNRLELNSTALLNFNKSATLEIVNLTFANPRILFDGVACPSDICVKNSYSSGVLNFNVSHFTIFSTEETSSTGSGGSSGGGGGGIVSGIKNFSISEDKIRVLLKPGETRLRYIRITNTETKKLKFSLASSGLEGFIILRENDFELEAGESKLLALDFIAKEDIIPNLYIGKIIVKGDNIEKEILIALEIISKKPLFDVILEIPKKYSQVLPGEYISANIKLFDITKIGQVDVNLDYSIVDKDGRVIISNEETIAIYEQANFVKNLQIPLNIVEGNYLFYIKVNYNDEVASASEWFEVVKKEKNYFRLEIAIIIILVIFLIIILIVVYRTRKQPKRYGKMRMRRHFRANFHQRK